MTEGVIAAWHKKVGDPVKKGELLAEIETDKATMELESYKDGTLLHVGAGKGGKIQVNDLLAIIGQHGEDISAHVSGESANSAAPPGAKGEAQKQEPAAAPKQETPQTATSAAASTIDISKMEEVVLMPRLSDTMTEGVIAGWHKKVGDAVKKGDLLADIETDKATMELESYKDGKLLYQGAEKGQKIAVNDLLCIIGDEGKVDVQAIIAASKGGSQPQAAPAAQAAAAEQTTSQPTGNQLQPQTESAPQQPAANGRVLASPLAKKLAAERGIDIRQVQGTGDGGRIVKNDIAAFVPKPAAPQQQPAAQPQAAQEASQAPAAAPQPVVQGQEGFTDTPVSQMRKVIAKRLSESKFGAPHFYLTAEITMDKAMEARAQMNEVSDVKISFNDMVVKAAAMALRRHPAVNSSWMGDFIRQYQHINIGVAVAIEDGLIVPVVRFADQKTLSQIASETKALAAKAKSKKLQPAEFSGNTFTISNLGMMDIDEFTAIINPPDSAIMAVGRIKEIVVRRGDGFGVSNVMKVTLSCDHRSVDGAVGAGFLQTFRKYLENPVTMLV
jgi:pyruvate dehydrogenase E2 component (dihydrolipoamide acetyltransferase)